MLPDLVMARVFRALACPCAKAALTGLQNWQLLACSADSREKTLD